MRRIQIGALMLLLLVGCNGGAKLTPRIDELQAKNQALEQRVKALEDDLLAANKKMIQHEQTIQSLNERLRTVETDLDKLRLGQGR